MAQYRAACSTRSDRVCIAAPRGHPQALPTRDHGFTRGQISLTTKRQGNGSGPLSSLKAKYIDRSGGI